MQAVRLLRPARACVRSPTARGPSSCSVPRHHQLTNAAPSPLLRRLAPPASHSHAYRPFSHTSRRPNNWRDPRHQRHDDPYAQLSRARPLISADGLSRLARSPSLHTVVLVSAAGAVAFYFWNTQTVPVSGRRRFNCFSEAKVEAASAAQVKRLEWEVERKGGRFLDERDWRTVLVRRVLRRLVPVSGMEGSEWEVRVIDDPHTANAFVLPGGKVFVFSGLIPIARNEHGMAAVLGHEIAHNLAEHVGERMSSQIGINILLYSLIFLTGGIAILGTSFIGGTVLDLLFSRPMGRRQESEADYIGLMMMAEACYDPREALGFWQRMEGRQREEPPEWMSTHPSNHNRIQKIQEWMPKALEKMHESDCQGTSTFATLFRQALQRGAVIERQDDV
ncbi:peptidase family M48-domain-containing protein [Xylariaceae sp. FL1651]|nr:peptidase family M48-domain-containing protein [Xylariaceae sp. FL1651]